MNVSTRCKILFSTGIGTTGFQLQATEANRVLKNGFDGTASVTLNNNGELYAGGPDPIQSGCQMAYCGSNVVRVSLLGGKKIMSCGVSLTFVSCFWASP